jgi:hypothetical protein
MPITVVQTAISAGGAYNGSFGANVTSGNSVILGATGYTGSSTAGTTSSPTQGGSTPPGSVRLFPDQWGATLGCAAWLLPDCPGGSVTFALTVTNYGTNSLNGLLAVEVAGLGTSPSVDQNAVGTGTGVTVSLTTGAITSAPEFIFAMYGQDNGFPISGPGSGWSAAIGNWGGGLNGAGFYQIATSSGGTYNQSWTNDGAGVNWAAGIGTVQTGSAASGPSGSLPILTASPVMMLVRRSSRVSRF